MGEDEKQGSKTVPSSDLSDYTIIKEGEAEILMHAKNEVFYNKTQVFLCLIVLAILVIVENIVFRMWVLLKECVFGGCLYEN
ncbi:tRNA (guanine(26)-N(2))-dimethyltransferase [Actinidia rufa]|uniref:tRNA (Guanine(26)-N(2))-dimethyltransferase n=1 Tax=Actinidia rufa TaxID=165716 RepID=A0A7J0EG34_9ERIC|nr:tRNA (guanine(26)-N(2))-dimethyltransferase [Actinidia rufa]